MQWLHAMLCVLGMWMVTSGALGAALHHSQTCVWRSSISPTLPRLQEAVPRADCKTGSLLWYYPEGGGRLRVVFRRESVSTPAFTLCLRPESFTGMLAVTRTYEGKEETMINNGAGDICRPSDSTGVANVTFTAASPSPDLLTISYYRQLPP